MCDVKDAICVIRCSGYNEEDNGQTGDSRKRVTIHNQQICNIPTRMSRMSMHIDECSASISPNYTSFPLFFNKMNTDCVIRRKKRNILYTNFNAKNQIVFPT